jgi:hypothetical protein
MFRTALAVVILGPTVVVAQAPRPSESAAVLQELGLADVPGLPKKLPQGYEPDRVAADEVMKHPDKYPVRFVVLGVGAKALHLARPLPYTDEFLDPPQKAQRDKLVLARQEEVARAILAFEEAVHDLDLAADQVKKEPSKRWQAHHAYATARLKLQLAAAHELDLVWGQIRTGVLPGLTAAKGENGWRLVPSEKMASRRDVRQLAEDARKALEQVRKDHPDTPWAKLAEKDLDAKVGLKWEPAVLKVTPPKKPKK